MRIENVRTAQHAGRIRLMADAIWEERQHPLQELYFETREEFASALDPVPDPFLIASILPAMHHGERRIAVDGEICPALKEGLVYITSMMRHWFYTPQRAPIRIEVRSGSPRPRLGRGTRAACLFSGGVDSLALLWNNHLNYPKDHPWSIQDGLLILGQNIES
ncbi:MAG: hypothetical protein ACREQV_02820, partial [Candidatus Binatia bacterium]